jgi:zona occludens toxin (predicted ATPase)
LKLNNYDVVSFNEFAYNNSTLYNFKVDEETFNKLVSAQLKVALDAYNVTGSVGMIKLLMSKNYKYEVSITLERQIKPNDLIIAQAVEAKDTKKKDPKGKPKGGKEPEKKPQAVVKPLVNANQVYSS